MKNFYNIYTITYLNWSVQRIQFQVFIDLVLSSKDWSMQHPVCYPVWYYPLNELIFDTLHCG